MRQVLSALGAGRTGILWGGVAGWGWGHSKLPNHSFGEVHECVDGTLVSKQQRELRDS